MSQKLHHLYGGSKHRHRLGCPGSVVREADLPERESTPEAIEGDRLHDLAEAILTGSRLVDVGHKDDPIKRMKTEQIVGEYVDYVNGIRDANPAVDDVEVYISPETTDVHEFGGTLDYVASYVDQTKAGVDKTVLHVVDFKAGIGDLVTAFGNVQGLSYLAMARAKHGPHDVYRFTIVQPQRGGVDSTDVANSAIDQLIIDIEKAQANTDRFDVGSHCQYCKANEICVDVQEAVEEIAVLSKAIETPVGEWGGFENDAELDAALRRAYTVKSAVTKFLGSLNTRMIARMKIGAKYGGLKCVNSLSNKKWIHDEETTVKKLRNRRLALGIVTKRKLLSPTQLADLGYDKNIAGLFHREVGGVTLVKESDRREAVEFKTVEEQFSSDPFEEIEIPNFI